MTSTLHAGKFASHSIGRRYLRLGNTLIKLRVVPVLWPEQRTICPAGWASQPLSDAEIAETVAIVEESGGIEAIRRFYIERLVEDPSAELRCFNTAVPGKVVNWDSQLRAKAKLVRDQTRLKKWADCISIDVAKKSIKYGAFHFEKVSITCLLFLKALLEAKPGDYVKSCEIYRDYFSKRNFKNFNASKARANLPPMIRALVEVRKGPGGGSRLSPLK